jgi:hypothetical protein
MKIDRKPQNPMYNHPRPWYDESVVEMTARPQNANLDAVKDDRKTC